MIRFGRSVFIFVLITSALFFFQNCGEGFDSSQEASIAFLKNDPLSSVPPVMNITTNVGRYIPQSILNVEFNAQDSFKNIITEFQCAINGEAFSRCQSPLRLTSLEDGDYVLEVKAIDIFKNETIESISWTVDFTAPRVIVNDPPPLTGSRNLNISFTASDNLSGLDRLECSLNGVIINPCTSPLNFLNLEPATYNLSIVAFDKAGHQFLSNTVNWQISRAAPTLNLSRRPPSSTNSRQAEFTMLAEGPDGVRDFQCRLNGAQLEICNASVSYSNLPEGNNLFEFRIVNQLGVASQMYRYNWTVDTIAPGLEFSTTDPPSTINNHARFTFNATDSGSRISTIECSLDGGAFTTCATPHNFSGLDLGPHTLVVRATDNATNRRQISRSWTRVAESNCIGLGPCLHSPRALVSNASGQKLYSINVANNAIIEIELATGNRKTVSSVSMGIGPQLEMPRDLIISPDNQRLYVIDAGIDALLSINLLNGDRTIVSNANRGTGPNFINPVALVFNPAAQNILVLDNSSGRKIIIQADLDTGVRTNMSGVNVGTGDQLSNPRDMVINANSNALFITDTAYNGLRRVDLANGNRSYFGPAGTTGISISNSLRLERNASGDRYYVSLNQSSNTIVEINMTNGQRRRVSNGSIIFLQENSITGMSVNPNTTKLHIVGNTTRNFSEVDIANGTISALFAINTAPITSYINDRDRDR